MDFGLSIWANIPQHKPFFLQQSQPQLNPTRARVHFHIQHTKYYIIFCFHFIIIFYIHRDHRKPPYDGKSVFISGIFYIMASEDVVSKTSATIVNLAEEAKIASEGVKAPSRHALLSICKSLVAGGVAGGVLVHFISLFCFFHFKTPTFVLSRIEFAI